MSLVSIVCTVSATVSLGCTSAEDSALPAPTGPHAIGRSSFHWKDSARDELETKAADDKRELMVHLFHPADPGAQGERAAYVPDAEVMRGPWNDEQMARITALRAHGRENADLPPGDARYPVVVFSPGGGFKGLTYHALCEDLASHGYVVAAIDPPYNAPGVRLPDGRVLGNLPQAERGWPQPTNGEEERRFYRERVAHWARDVSFVIDELTKLDAGDGRFARRLDLARGVGVAGHSRGGQAAGTVRLIDARVRAGVNLDGIAGPTPVLSIDGGESMGAAPFLWIQKPPPPPPSEERLKRSGHTRAEYDAEIQRVHDTWHGHLARVERGALRVVIERAGFEHIDFSDEPFWDGHTTAEGRPGKLATIADTRTWLRAFFDGTLRGDWQTLKELCADAGKPHGGVTVHVFGTMWK